MPSRTIGQLAKEVGIDVETVRYYERIGLLARPTREGSGWRRYPEEALTRLRYVREGRAVGFSLKEVAALLRLTRDGRPRFCNAFDGAVNEKIAALDRLMGARAARRARLEEFSRACRQRRAEHRCPILERLAEAAKDRGGSTARSPIPPL